MTYDKMLEKISKYEKLEGDIEKLKTVIYNLTGIHGASRNGVWANLRADSERFSMSLSRTEIAFLKGQKEKQLIRLIEEKSKLNMD